MLHYYGECWENGEVEGARLYAMKKQLINVLLVVWEPLQVWVRGAMGSELCPAGSRVQLAGDFNSSR